MTSNPDMISVRSASGTNFDRMFLTMLISQHSGAIEMAKTEKEDGKSPDAVAPARTNRDCPDRRHEHMVKP